MLSQSAKVSLNVLWMAFNYNSTVYSFYEIMLSHQFAYWPVAIGWAAIALFDSDFTKELFKAVHKLTFPIRHFFHINMYNTMS